MTTEPSGPTAPPTPPGGLGSPAPGATDPGLPAIQTLPARPAADPGLAPLSPATGEPVRPWTVWAGAVVLLLAAIDVVASLGLAMWDLASPFVIQGDRATKKDRFADATWLTSLWVTEPGSGWRVLLAVCVTVIAVLVLAAIGIIGFYAFRGYRWSRMGSLVVIGVSLATLTLNRLSWIAIPLVLLGCAPLWLAPTERFFARWSMLRHPEEQYGAPVEQVFYGPLPRFR